MRAVLYLALIIILLVILVLIAGVATANAPKSEGTWYGYANAMQWCVVVGGVLLIDAFFSVRRQMKDENVDTLDIFKWKGY
jgi:hypothetical protein